MGTIHHPNDAPECDRGSFICVRVVIDTSRPLCRGRLITLDDGKEHWVSFKYKMLTNFCYWCGCITHVDRDCELWIESESSLNPADQQFGSWLRAPPFQVSRKKVIMVPGFYAKKTQSLPSHHPFTPLPHTQLAVPQTPTSSPTIPSGLAKSSTAFSETQPFTDTNPPVAPEKPTVSTVPNLPNQSDFEDLIHEIDSEINRFDGEAAAFQNSKVPLPALNPISPFPPLHLLDPLPDRPDSQPIKPNPLSDLTNLGPALSQSQAQTGGKWVHVSRLAHLDENLPLDFSTGKRKSHSPQISSLSSKPRALGAAIFDENSFLTAEADFQPRRAL